MAKNPKPDLSEHEDESVALDDVLRTLLNAKPAPKKEGGQKAPQHQKRGADEGAP